MPMRALPAALVAALLVLASHALAQTAPGSGKGFLIDKHVAASVGCASCHAESPPRAAPPMATCLGCHGGSYEKLAEKAAADGEHNPHNSHQGQLPCATCHHVHKASQSFCNTCHNFDMTVP